MENTNMSEKEYYDVAKYLGNQVGRKTAFLQKTACMDQQTRELIAILDFINDIGDEDEKKEIAEIMPLIEKMGYANWNRDVLTDMALHIGMTEKRSKIGKKNADRTV
jgi:dissimilatory sulfite reductase (desulfoviridin) alpha/beta subunit